MKGAEKKSKDTGKFLVLHRSGIIAKTDVLTPRCKTIEGITVIDLKTMKLFDDESGKWESIPEESCDDIMSDAEEFESEYAEEEDEENEDESTLFPSGAKRCISPYLVWNICKAKFN